MKLIHFQETDRSTVQNSLVKHHLQEEGIGSITRTIFAEIPSVQFNKLQLPFLALRSAVAQLRRCRRFEVLTRGTLCLSTALWATRELVCAFQHVLRSCFTTREASDIIPLRAHLQPTRVFASGDAMAQHLIEKSDTWDYRRSLSIGFLGAWQNGVLMHYWYRALDRIVSPATNPASVLKKICCDEAVFAPQ
eukprot:3779-Heterococcus_DN1.PRE.1